MATIKVNQQGMDEIVSDSAAERAKVMRAIDKAREAAEAARGTWDVDVSVDDDDGVERFEVTITFSAHPSDMEGAACDAPWKEYGGDAIVQALESAGFRQRDCFINTYERVTFGGVSVPQYEDGVVMVMELDHD